jgi:hypothetical protein
MELGAKLFLEACAIINQKPRKVYKITQCPKCGLDVQLEQSNGVCWHCYPLHDPVENGEKHSVYAGYNKKTKQKEVK